MTAVAYFHCRPNSHPFQDRQLTLKEPAKIGRSVARCRPGPNNAVFDCKVLSRNHALLWYENGKFYLQDTKSSNGTFINNQRLSRASEESLAVEVNSCDIVQFGVDVVDNAKKVTHGCIVSQLRLYLPNGDEAKQSNHVWNYQMIDKVPYNNLYPSVQSQDLYQLHQYLKEALHREQMLEQKLALLQRLVVKSHDASEKGWQALIDEDRLLSRLEFLENQLQTFNKSQNEDSLQSKLQKIQEEKYIYENTSKETLRQALQEKLEAVRKVASLERSLSNTEDECTHLRLMQEQTQKELTSLAGTHQAKIKEIQETTEKFQETEKNNNETITSLEKEKSELEQKLSDVTAEKDTLQNSCDTLLEENGKLKQECEVNGDSSHNSILENQDVQLEIVNLLDNILQDPNGLPNLINSGEINNNLKEKLQQFIKVRDNMDEKGAIIDISGDEIKELKQPTLADHAEGGENLKETGEIRSELKDRGDEASFQLDDNASDLRQELMAANKELLAKEARVKMLRTEIQKMEETIKQLQTAHLQEIESRKAMENDLAQFREDRDRQAAALNEASRELQEALTARENLLEREETIRLEVEASERMMQMCADSSESASETEDVDGAERSGVLPDAFLIFRAKLKEIKVKLKQSNNQLQIAEEENRQLKENIEEIETSHPNTTDELQELNQKFSSVNEENSQLKEALTRVETENMSGADKLEESVKRIAFLEQENIHLKKQLETLEAQKLSEPAIAKEALLAKGESVEDKRTQLEQQLKEKDEALLRALSDLAEAALNLERKTDEVRQLQRDLTAAHETASSVSSLQDELSSVKSNLLKTEERRASLEKELEEKEESLQQTQGKLENEQSSSADRETKVKELQKEVTAKSELVASYVEGEEALRQKLNHCLSQLEEKENSTASLREELKTCSAQKDALQRDFNVLVKSLKAAESEKAEIEEELSKIQEERSKCEDVIREKLSKSATILEQSQQEAQKLATAIDSKDEELAEVTSRCQQLIRERDASLNEQQRSLAVRRNFVASVVIGLLALIVYLFLGS